MLGRGMSVGAGNKTDESKEAPNYAKHCKTILDDSSSIIVFKSKIIHPTRLCFSFVLSSSPLGPSVNWPILPLILDLKCHKTLEGFEYNFGKHWLRKSKDTFVKLRIVFWWFLSFPEQFTL